MTDDRLDECRQGLLRVLWRGAEALRARGGTEHEVEALLNAIDVIGACVAPRAEEVLADLEDEDDLC